MKAWVFFTCLLWLASIGVGMGILSAYDYTPGEKINSVQVWPGDSQIPRSLDRPTLVMFAHPKCPCSRASVGELAVLMTQCTGRLNALVLFNRPEGEGDEWVKSDLWRSAEAIPGVSVRVDDAGREAARFHAETSGHTVLYDNRGRLMFSGGITEARGHWGDNANLDAVKELVRGNREGRGGETERHETPVFGCSLWNPKQASGRQASAKDE
jgi:hypothetical protein